MKSIAIVYDGEINSYRAGSSVTMYGIYKELERSGFQVAQIDTGSIKEEIQRLQPASIYVYETKLLPIVLQHRFEIPIFCMIGDLDHLPTYYRFQFQNSILQQLIHPRNTLRAYRSIRRTRDSMVTLLKQCHRVGCHAAHHAQWLQKNGVQAAYYPTPMFDPKQLSRLNRDSFNPTRIVTLIGHLKGIATVTGMKLFVDEVVPLLESFDCEIRIIGGYAESLPDDIQKKLKHPKIKLLGQKQDIVADMIASDVIVVPTPIPLGIRVRILTAWSYGCCVVTHKANQSGIPEIRHRHNGFVGETGKELAEWIIQACSDFQLNKTISINARKEYEQTFAQEIAGKRIVDDIVKLIERQT